ncbi:MULTISPECIES: hypothetical protein [Aeromonas]|uniref:hypothetical protein n=1 Tax=Aeromonas TaxID=642 RepID=UPI000CDC4955|nr:MULTISPECIES: hypothetical protein [Aeromonas]AUZ79062.1 hypothetical protein C2U37_04810 [Aeromonas sp. ASNIH1]
MMLRYVPMLLILMLPKMVMAETNRTTLIEGCVEAIQIYENNQQYTFKAALITSLSEALRAGYCKGVIDEYDRGHDCKGDWLKRARYVAGYKDEKSLPPSTESLLRGACQS